MFPKFRRFKGKITLILLFSEVSSIADIDEVYTTIMRTYCQFNRFDIISLNIPRNNKVFLQFNPSVFNEAIYKQIALCGRNVYAS